MMDGFKQECKLCTNSINDGNFKVIEDVTKGIFNILSLKLTLNNETRNVMCTVCSSKLLATLDFKSTCAYTDDILFPYINLENSKSLDLKEIYAKEQSKQGRSTLDDREVCRLCFQLSSEHKSIQEVSVDDIQILIPEINFTVTTNPVICMKCHGELCVHSIFIKNCLEVDKNRNTVTIGVGDILYNDSNGIKSEPTDDETIFEIPSDTETEQHEERETSLHARNSLIDAEKPKKSKKRIYKTTTKNGGSKRKAKKRQHSRKKQAKPTVKVLKVTEYKCDKCEYTTRARTDFTHHQLHHKYPNIRLYKCDGCKFMTRYRDSLARHSLRHKDPSELRMFKCEECDYKSLQKSCLKTHQLKHRDPSEVPKFECGECDYKSIHKRNLKTHQLKHKNPSEVRMYECDECRFKTIFKVGFTRHRLRHRASRVQV